MRMQAVDIEGDNGTFAGRTTIDLEPIDARQPLVRVGSQIRLVGGDQDSGEGCFRSGDFDSPKQKTHRDYSGWV